jgi:hypothetical protein
MVNTGFVVAQNLPWTFEILDVWMACTGGETRYGAECGKWREQWAHEQSVFSDYLRWDFNPGGDNIRVSFLYLVLAPVRHVRIRFRLLLVEMCDFLSK